MADREIKFGIQECSKCKYKLRCEECVYNEKDISKLIKFEKANASKETARGFAEKVKMAFYYEFDELIPSIMADKIDEIAKQFEVEVE